MTELMFTDYNISHRLLYAVRNARDYLGILLVLINLLSLTY